LDAIDRRAQVRRVGGAELDVWSLGRRALVGGGA